jgi:hypothetical protein
MPSLIFLGQLDVTDVSKDMVCETEQTSFPRNVRSVMPLKVLEMFCLEKVSLTNYNSNVECDNSNDDVWGFYDKYKQYTPLSFGFTFVNFSYNYL